METYANEWGCGLKRRRAKGHNERSTCTPFSPMHDWEWQWTYLFFCLADGFSDLCCVEGCLLKACSKPSFKSDSFWVLEDRLALEFDICTWEWGIAKVDDDWIGSLSHSHLDNSRRLSHKYDRWSRWVNVSGMGSWWQKWSCLYCEWCACETLERKGGNIWQQWGSIVNLCVDRVGYWWLCLPHVESSCNAKLLLHKISKQWRWGRCPTLADNRHGFTI